MATLQVTNLQNTAATVTNVSLLADGSTTIVLNATGTNRTGGLRYNAGNLEVYTSGGIWVAAGGGSGTVTGVTGTAPIVSSGGAAPVLSILPATGTTAGSMSAADKAKLDGAATIVSAVTGTLPITVATGTSTPVIAINAATNAAAGSIEIATLAEAATGTDATRASTPETSVPKDASGMTGAALLPTGTLGQRPTPVAGMLRMNTTLNPDSLEAYDGTTSSWRQVAYEPVRTALPSYTATNGTALPSSGTYDCITIPAGVTVTSTGISRLCAITCVTIDGTINSDGLGFRGPSNSLTNGNASVVGSASPAGQGFGAAIACCGGNSYGWASFTPSTGTAGSAVVCGGTGIAGYAGNSGGVVIMSSDGPITVGAAALVSANATNALPASIQGGTSGADVGGGGGSSGGMIALQSKTSLTLAAGAQLCVAGSAGSNGVSNTGGATGAGGGGGGGGGYIILNSPATTDASTKVLTGGAAGSGVGVSATAPGGGGGGWGGAGGRAGDPALAAAAGSAGQVLLNNYL